MCVLIFDCPSNNETCNQSTMKTENKAKKNDSGTRNSCGCTTKAENEAKEIDSGTRNSSMGPPRKPKMKPKRMILEREIAQQSTDGERLYTYHASTHLCASDQH